VDVVGANPWVQVLIHSTGKVVAVDSAEASGVDQSQKTTLRRGSASSATQDDSHESRRVETGRDWLDNNGVNLLMAASMSIGAMAISQWLWGLDVTDLLV
jgi:hypothetical protein